MNGSDEIAALVATLNKYVESKKKALEEENAKLMAEGRKEFAAAISERVSSFGKPDGAVVFRSLISQANIRQRVLMLSDVIKQPEVYFSLPSRLASVRITLRHRRNFRLFRRVQDLAVYLLLQAELPPDNERKLMASALLIRLIESTKSGVELSRRGLERDAAVMIRVSFDHYLLLRGCCSCKEFTEKYIKTELGLQLQFGMLDISPEQCDDRDRQQELGGERWSAEAREHEIEQMVRDLGMMDEYSFVLGLTNSFYHPSIRDLEEEGRLIGRLLGPTDRYTEIYVLTLTEYLLRGAGELGGLLEFTRHLQRWRRMYAELQELQLLWPSQEQVSLTGRR